MQSEASFERFVVKDYKHWTLFIHANQFILGRVYIWAKRKDCLDFADITLEEREELFEVMKKVKVALSKLFQPDLFNWDALGNYTHHMHLHVLPRYRTPRTFDGREFKDVSWGNRYSTAAYGDTPQVPEETIHKIKAAIQGAL